MDTEEALQNYVDGKISTERLAEEMGVNYYVLHNAFRRGSQLFEPKPDSSRLLTICFLGIVHWKLNASSIHSGRTAS